MARLPPSDSRLAVKRASPSLPFGSLAEPTLKSKRKVTSGDELGRVTDAIAGAAFPASATGARADEAMLSATINARLLLRNILLLLLLGQRDDGAVFRDKILLRHRLQVSGRDRRINVVELVDRLRRPPQRDERRQVRRYRLGVVERQREA